MFKEKINRQTCSLMSPMVNSMCAGKLNFSHDSGYDDSFEATFRALMINRLDEIEDTYNCFTYVVSSYRNYAAFSSSNDAYELFRRRELSFECGESLIFINMNMTSDWMPDIEYIFKADVLSGWKKVEKVTQFFQKSFKVMCYINTQEKRTLLFVEKADIRRYHFVQSGIFAYMPWFFNKDTEFTEDQMALIRALTEKTGDKYCEAAERIFKSLNLRETMIDKLLGRFEAKMFDQRVNRLERENDNYLTKIKKLMREIGDTNNLIRENQIKIFGIRTNIENASVGELANYFRTRQNLELISADDMQVSFAVKGYLDTWEEDAADSIVNGDLYFDRYSSFGDCSNDNARKIFKHFLIDRDIKIKTCSAWQIQVGNRVIGLTGSEFGPEYNGYMPNPHIQRYGCFGTYGNIFSQLLIDGNYVMIIEQCFASNDSLNLMDGVVMREFITSLFNNKTVCIELPDGTVTDWKGALAYINENEGENNEKSDS